MDDSTTNPPNTDISNTTQGLDSLSNSGDRAQQVVRKVANGLSALGDASKDSADNLSIFDKVAKMAEETIGGIGKESDGASGFFKRFADMSLQSANAFNLMNAALMGAPRLLKNIAKDESLTSFSSQIKTLANDASGLSGPLGAIAKMMGVNLSNSSGLLRPLEEVKREVLNLGEAIDSSINFQRAVFNVAAQSGQLNTLFALSGTNLEKLSNVSKDYADQLSNVQKATHITREEAGKYFNDLGQLPPIYNDNADAATKAANTVSQLATDITLAHGSGQTFNQVLTQSKTLLETFNVPAARANEITAEGSELSKAFGLNITDTTSFLTQMAGTFQLLGDNTEGVSGIFKEFFGGLREGGLGIKPAIETIAQMGQSLAHLTIAQKAFLSAQSGGPGGLLGGIQIERDLAAGKSQEVMEKLRKSFLQHTGGQVITRDQVNDQATASQYERQVKMLQSGAFGGIAKTDEQAAAILKAFSKPNDKKSADTALQDVMKQGADYQKLSYTALDHIGSTLDDIALHGGFAGADLVQSGLTSLGASEGENNALNANTADAKNKLKRVGGSGSDMSTQYSNEANTALGRDFTGLGTTFGSLFSAIKTATVSPKHATGQSEADMRKELDQKLSQTMHNRTAGMSKDEMAKALQALDQTSGSKSSIVGAAVNHSLGNAGAHGAVPAHLLQANTGAHLQGKNTGGTAADKEKINLTINVNVDGKKLMQSNQNVALHGQPINN